MSKDHNYYVYIVTNTYNRVLYTGFTNNLIERVGQHRLRSDKKAFTARYNLWKLVFFERRADVNAAIAREKQIKAGSRKAKIDLVKSMNPDWKDLMASL